MKDICKMNCAQIGKYLNTGHHNHPSIMKHSGGYDVHYSIEDGGHGLRKYVVRENLNLKDAIKIFKMK